MHIAREFEPGMGRIDILVVRYDQNRLRQRCRIADTSPLGRFDLLAGYAMTFLVHRRWVTLGTLAAAIGTDSRRTRIVVSLLESRGLVDKRANCVKAKAMSTLWVIDSIETYEVKLSHWRRVIEQAQKHLWFASKSFVAVPDRSATVSRVIVEGCRQHDIGAVLCRKDSTWVSAKRPPNRSTPVTQVGWLLNEAIVAGGSNGGL